MKIGLALVAFSFAPFVVIASDRDGPEAVSLEQVESPVSTTRIWMKSLKPGLCLSDVFDRLPVKWANDIQMLSFLNQSFYNFSDRGHNYLLSFVFRFNPATNEPELLRAVLKRGGKVIARVGE